jgi:hypothetical protein
MEMCKEVVQVCVTAAPGRGHDWFQSHRTNGKENIVNTIAKSIIGFAAGAVVLGGCSGATSFNPSTVAASSTAYSSTELGANPLAKIFPMTSQPSRARAWNRARPEAAMYIYSCQPYSYTCNIYDQSGNIDGQLTASSGLDQPGGIVTDRKGNWFIANSGASDVLVFAPGATQAFATLGDSGATPIDVAVSKSLVAASSFSPASVAIYEGTATEPSYTLTDSNALYGFGVAIDKSGNCFWAYDAQDGNAYVDEFSSCEGSAKQVHKFPSKYNPSNFSGGAGGLAADGNGIVVGAWSTGEYMCLFCSKQPCPNPHELPCEDIGAAFSDIGSPTNLMYIANMSGSIQTFNLKTSQLITFTTQGLSSSNPPLGAGSSTGTSSSPY